MVSFYYALVLVYLLPKCFFMFSQGTPHGETLGHVPAFTDGTQCKLVAANYELDLAGTSSEAHNKGNHLGELSLRPST
jgi:hypothetical protein